LRNAARALYPCFKALPHLAHHCRAISESSSKRIHIKRIVRKAMAKTKRSKTTARRPMSPDVILDLRQTRESVSGGRTLSDSTEIIRRMREERSEYLGTL
jgi:hypothetical protein